MFVNGSVSYSGWWYYFPLAMLYKTPLATLIALALAGIYCIARRGRFENADPWAIAVVVMTPAFYFVAAVASDVNVGIRHLLPVYPFFYVLVGVVAARSIRRFPKLTKVILPLLAAGLRSKPGPLSQTSFLLLTSSPAAGGRASTFWVIPTSIWGRIFRPWPTGNGKIRISFISVILAQPIRATTESITSTCPAAWRSRTRIDPPACPA